MQHVVSEQENDLGCPKCNVPLAVGMSGADCPECQAHFAVEDGILCTDRTDAFLGEFDATRMHQFVQLARDQGWRKVAEGPMGDEDPSARNVLLGSNRATFMELFKQSSPRNILDVGAGMGAISLQLAKRFKQVYSLDLAFDRLAFLRVIAEQEDIAEKIRAICHRNVLSLPFKTGALDAAAMVGVFEYFPASYPHDKIRDVQLKALTELHRVISPGGELFIATKNRYGWPHWAGAVDNSGLRFGPLMPRWLADTMSRILLKQPFRIVTDGYSDNVGLLQEAGFTDIRFYWPVPGYQSPLHWVDLADDGAVKEAVKRYVENPVKRGVLTFLVAIGVFKYLVPHFGIMAKKAE
ncbi:class I SAM-dependent methyltransferase [Pseudomonadota bacterium]